MNVLDKNFYDHVAVFRNVAIGGYTVNVTIWDGEERVEKRYNVPNCYDELELAKRAFMGLVRMERKVEK